MTIRCPNQACLDYPELTVIGCYWSSGTGHDGFAPGMLRIACIPEAFKVVDPIQFLPSPGDMVGSQA